MARIAENTLWIAVVSASFGIFVACGDDQPEDLGSCLGGDAGERGSSGHGGAAEGGAPEPSGGGDGGTDAAEAGAAGAGRAGAGGRGGNAGTGGRAGGGGAGGTLGGASGSAGAGISAMGGGGSGGAAGGVAGNGGASSRCGNGTLDPGEACDTPFAAENCGEDCAPISPTACTACVAADPECGPVADCSKVPGVAPAGSPAAGTARANLCREQLDCIRDTGCSASGLALDCYCGTATPSACTAGMGVGACRTEIERGLETMDPNEVFSRFSDSMLGGGFANIRISCEQTLCASECGFPNSN